MCVHSEYQMMRPPPPSIDAYMSALLKTPGPQTSSAAVSTNPLAAASAANQELTKLRQLQAKKAELQQQLQAVEAQMFKVQGALEVLQTLGYVTKTN